MWASSLPPAPRTSSEGQALIVLCFYGLCGVVVSSLQESPSSKGSRSCFLAKWIFGGLGDRGQTTAHFMTNIVFLALPPKAARPKHEYLLGHVLFFGLDSPGLQKTTWPKNHFGVPLTSGYCRTCEAVGKVVERTATIPRQGSAASSTAVRALIQKPLRSGQGP